MGEKGKMIYYTSTSFLVALLLAQVFIISFGGLTLQYYRVIKGQYIVLVALCILLNYVFGLSIVRKLFQGDDFRNTVNEQSIALRKTEGLLKNIRIQRHDILNHMQTIYALMQMGKDQHAKKYMSELYLITINTNQIVRLDDPVVASFLQSKLNQANVKGIDLNIEANTSLNKCPVKSNFLICIFGNLLDNAFDVLKKVEGERKIEIIIYKDDLYYFIKISNTGPSISDEVLEKMYTSGFSTKGTGRGYGLALVKEAVDNYEGTITVEKNPTTFIIKFPQLKGEQNDS